MSHPLAVPGALARSQQDSPTSGTGDRKPSPPFRGSSLTSGNAGRASGPTRVSQPSPRTSSRSLA